MYCIQKIKFPIFLFYYMCQPDNCKTKLRILGRTRLYNKHILLYDLTIFVVSKHSFCVGKHKIVF